MWTVADTALNAPPHVSEAETDQRPRRKVAAKSFELHNRNADGNTDQPEHNRAKHMPQPVGKGNPNRFNRAPFSRTSHDDKQKIMTRPRQYIHKNR